MVDGAIVGSNSESRRSGGRDGSCKDSPGTLVCSSSN